MKKLFIILSVPMILSIASVCIASPHRPGPYVSGFMGISVPLNANVTGFDYYEDISFNERVEFDPGINLGGTAGYDFGIFRLEGELSYKEGEIANISDQAGTNRYRNADGTLGALAMMFNAFFDLHNSSPVTPYLGGGIGFAAMHLSDTFGTLNNSRIILYEEDDDSVFAYQVGAGLEVALNPRLSLDFGYRYFATTKARFGTNLDIATDLKFESHNTAVGLRVKF